MNWYERMKMAEKSADLRVQKNTRTPKRALKDFEVEVLGAKRESLGGKTAGAKRAAGRTKEAADIIRIRKRTTLESVFGEYIEQIASLIKKERPDLATLELSVRKANNLGFRLTKRSLDGSTIPFYVDCTFTMAPEHVKIMLTGMKDGSNFSNTLRMFLYDPLMKTARRISGNIPSA